MDIKKYSSFFHDGGIIDVVQIDDKVEISMESSELDREDNKDNIPLSKFNRIKGKLHLERVQNIIVDNKPVSFIKMIYDSGEILDFEIYENKKVLLGLVWSNYSPKKHVRQWQSIKIEAKRIYWENIPDLFDPME
jgi:hypothetical protein